MPSGFFGSVQDLACVRDPEEEAIQIGSLFLEGSWVPGLVIKGLGFRVCGLGLAIQGSNSQSFAVCLCCNRTMDLAEHAPQMVGERRHSKLYGSFRKEGGTSFWGPYNKDPTIWGTILGSPIFGNPPYHPLEASKLLLKCRSYLRGPPLELATLEAGLALIPSR